MKLLFIIPLLMLPISVSEKAYQEEIKTGVPENVHIFSPEIVKVVEAIKQKETRGNCTLKGASGEIGCMQYMPATWKALSKKYYGEVKSYSTTTEEILTLKALQDLGDLKPQQYFQYWNQGTYKKPCIRGTNKHGVKYDSCAYIKDALRIYNNL